MPRVNINFPDELYDKLRTHITNHYGKKSRATSLIVGRAVREYLDRNNGGAGVGSTPNTLNKNE